MSSRKGAPIAAGSTRLSDDVHLEPDEIGILTGSHGLAGAMSMRIILAAARAQGASRLIPVSAAHVDSCLYHGPSSIDFAKALLDGGGQVQVPTTLNVGGIDLSRPDIFIGSAEERDGSRELMNCYVQLGCQPTFTCAPYQLPGRPEPGADVAWAESNAIVFGNSMIGLRTNRYGDLIDICAAITGRVPYSGLHVPENRAARAVFTVEPDVQGTDPDLLPALLGHHVGRRTGSLVPVIDGLQGVDIDEDWGKSFGSASASSGGVAMFHIAGVTPEAPDLATSLRGQPPLLELRIGVADVAQAHRELTSAAVDAPLGGVSIGTPHLSRNQLIEMADQLAGRSVRVPTYATSSRSVFAAEPDAVRSLVASGVTVVADTCTYGPSKVMKPDGAVLTNSAKWAYYAPSHLGFQVLLASRFDCLESAVRGEIVLRHG
ncbi:aconitase X [uncultured Jatrophihabitans sp.]|uniref:aconitase X n=1 Tax=uncultured Jatrophihabitans sp. TaxID=1610747 RepID=UPI0035CBE5FB